MLFHLAKKGTLKEGTILEPKLITDISYDVKDPSTNIIYSKQEPMTTLLQDYYSSTFSKGTSNHGEQYFAYGDRLTYMHPFVELLLEKSRQATDKNLPSRANSIFALDSIESFPKLCQLMNININEYDIWEVESENVFKADMFLIDTIQKCLAQNCSILLISMFSDYYWNGYPLNKFWTHDECFWEYLLELPVKVIRKVDM